MEDMKTAFSPARGRFPSVMAAARMMAFIVVTVSFIPIYWLSGAFRNFRAGWRGRLGHPNFVPKLLSLCLLKITGIRVRTHGIAASIDAPVMFVSNHSSYFDIPVLGAVVPAPFVAKSEVAKWPLIGFMAKLQGSIFVERKKGRSGDQKSFLADMFKANKSLILFPEGTSSDGSRALPFKSTLFGAAEAAVAAGVPLTLQPVSTLCTEIRGLPMARAWRHLYAWFGDMTLLPHMWEAFRVGHFTVDVVFHPPVRAANFPNRKAMAEYCYAEVDRGVSVLVSGRIPANFV